MLCGVAGGLYPSAVSSLQLSDAEGQLKKESSVRVEAEMLNKSLQKGKIFTLHGRCLVVTDDKQVPSNLPSVLDPIHVWLVQ